ncbi:MAG: hypothetical protein J7K47_02460 [Thermoplasmata archaeon]|nr:hypothetical protein [Thermoplasmata archaeon]
MKKKEPETNEKEIKEMSNWLHRLQQSIESLEKRLDAIERRLSNESFESSHLIMKEKENRKVDLPKDIEKLIRKLQDEIEDLKNRVKERRIESKETKEPIISIRKSEQKAKNYDNAILDIERRLEKLERRKATVKVGKIEVPIEITGIVGGLLAFLIAILLLEGYKRLVISPGFVGFIGIALIAATAVKTYMMNVSRK